MKRVDPAVKTTVCSPDLREWVPSSVDNFLRERDRIVKSAEAEDHLVLFRGQSDSEWLLDSTLVRDCMVRLFSFPRVPSSIRQQVSFHRLIASLILMKFGTIWKPSKEAFEKEKSHGIDPWFELLKHVQQYPEKYEHIKFANGTFFLDWTIAQDIGLYFAVFDGPRGSRKIASSDGALWIYDSSATGNILQEEKLCKIMVLMSSEEYLDGNRTFPLMFHPIKQTKQNRALNQKPIYIAQMDFRYDLADVWANYEHQVNVIVFYKLRILHRLKAPLAKYLESQNITEAHVYPD